MSSEPYVLTEVDDGIGWIVLNEPARLNPTGGNRILEINAAASELSERDEVRVVVVTGAGRGFCSGADLSMPIPADMGTPGEVRLGSRSVLDSGPGMWTLMAIQKPVIAMVNGPAVGYGTELALQADLRIAGRSARFRLPFAKLGVVSDIGAGSWLLPRLVGWSRAADLLFTGRMVEADEAKEIGLVNYVVPDEELRQFTTAYAQTMVRNSPWAMRTMKRMLYAGLDESKREHLVEQAFRFRERGNDVDRDAYAGRFRLKGAQPPA